MSPGSGPSNRVDSTPEKGIAESPASQEAGVYVAEGENSRVRCWVGWGREPMSKMSLETARLSSTAEGENQPPAQGENKGEGHCGQKSV